MEKPYWYAELDETEKSIIDPSDWGIRSVIKGIDPEIKKELHQTTLIKKEHYNEYCLLQTDWIRNHIYFFGKDEEEHGRTSFPEKSKFECEGLFDYSKKGYDQLFRIYILAKHPDWIEPNPACEHTWNLNLFLASIDAVKQKAVAH